MPEWWSLPLASIATSKKYLITPARRWGFPRANLCAEAMSENRWSSRRISAPHPQVKCLSLAGPLTIAFRLVRIHLPHFPQQIFCVRPGNIGRFRPTAITLFRPPRDWSDRFFRAFWHAKILRRNQKKASWSERETLRNPRETAALYGLACERTRCQDGFHEVLA